MKPNHIFRMNKISREKVLKGVTDSEINTLKVANCFFSRFQNKSHQRKPFV